MTQESENEAVFKGGLTAVDVEAALGLASNLPQMPAEAPVSCEDETIEEVDAITESIFYNAKGIIDINNIVKDLRDDKDIIEKLTKEATKHVFEEIISSKIRDKYKVIFLYSKHDIVRAHASRIHTYLYSDRLKAQRKDILLFLKSKGGELETAYLISKMCGKVKNKKFVVAIPAEAKSAATLLSLGADEIHMGPLSELGPIDPQIDGYPALAFASAIEKLAKIAVAHPGSERIFSEYLSQSKLNLINLGHYERKTASASQYATRLLKQRSKTAEEIHKGQMSDEEIATHFTTHFKDHNFVIDTDESITILGKSIIKVETNEYYTSHRINIFIESLQMSLNLSVDKDITIALVGDKLIIA